MLKARRAAAWEEINFLLTNRIPRRLLTQFTGWWSRIEQPQVRDLSLMAFRLFAGNLALEEAKKERFSSLHDCFVRELKEGARHIDADPTVAVSPCDGIVGASGRIRGRELIQAKGFTYRLDELLHDPALISSYTDGIYVTLRLKASMYHRFHAPYDCSVRKVTYISGDTWNVNPVSVRKIEKLFCKNERVVVTAELAPSGARVSLVAVAAVLVASVQLAFLDTALHLKYRGPNVIDCEASFQKGEELGFFQHGSTIIVFAPPGLELCESVKEGSTIRMGQPLLRLP